MVSLNKVLTISVTDSPLSVTNKAELAKFVCHRYSFNIRSRNGNVLFKLTSLNDFDLKEGPVRPNVQFKKVLTISMLQIVL